MTEKTRKNLARRKLERRGYRLVKSRRRNPKAMGYGGHMIVHTATNSVEAGEIDSPLALDLEDVETWLKD